MSQENTNPGVEQINFDFSTDYQLQTLADMSNRTYTNTVRVHPHRRKLKIISQTANTMEADIEPIPANGNGEQDGTPITAEIMQEFHNVIHQADINAKNSFRMTNEIANRVATYLAQCNQNFINLEQQIVNQQGTQVMVGGNYVSTFNTDTKLDVNVYNSNHIISDVSYDPVTDTFIF